MSEKENPFILEAEGSRIWLLKKKALEDKLLEQEMYLSGVKEKHSRHWGYIIGFSVMLVLCLAFLFGFHRMNVIYDQYDGVEDSVAGEEQPMVNPTFIAWMRGARGLLTVVEMLLVVVAFVLVVVILYQVTHIVSVYDRFDGLDKGYRKFLRDAELRIKETKREILQQEKQLKTAQDKAALSEKKASHGRKPITTEAFQTDMTHVETDADGNYVIPLEVALKNLTEEATAQEE